MSKSLAESSSVEIDHVSEIQTNEGDEYQQGLAE